MFPTAPNLICFQTEETAGDRRGRVIAKVCAASLARNLPVADIRIARPEKALDAGGLFRVEKAGIMEMPVPQDAEEEAMPAPWAWLETPTDTAAYPWVLNIGSGSIALRSVDHLLTGDADILWAPMPGVPVTAERCGHFLKDEERSAGYRVEYPFSRPYKFAASAEVWAVRGPHFRTVMEQWRKIALGGNLQCRVPPIESAWNRLLMDTPLKVARFEKNEVQFPSLSEANFLTWKDSCILNVRDWPKEAQAKFLQAWFYGTFFADETGLFLEIVEP